MIYIGVDLGGTSIKIGLVRTDRLLAQMEIEAQAHVRFEIVLPRIAATVNALLAAHAEGAQPGGIGLSFPGIVDDLNRKILSGYVKYPGAHEVDLPAWARETWGIPLALENDARAALVAEWQFGAAQGYRHAVLMTLGTGVGSAVLMDGRLLRGAHHMGGNLGGHMVIQYRGHACNCGSRGCLETEASTWALPARYGQDPRLPGSLLADANPLDFRAVFAASDAGDALATEIRDHCLQAWAAGAINLVHGFDPEVLILGGGIMRSGGQIAAFVRHHLDTYSWLPPGTVQVLPAQQAQDAGLLGMAYLAKQARF